jgi:hypothetical protein
MLRVQIMSRGKSQASDRSTYLSPVSLFLFLFPIRGAVPSVPVKSIGADCFIVTDKGTSSDESRCGPRADRFRSAGKEISSDESRYNLSRSMSMAPSKPPGNALCTGLFAVSVTFDGWQVRLCFGLGLVGETRSLAGARTKRSKALRGRLKPTQDVLVYC